MAEDRFQSKSARIRNPAGCIPESSRYCLPGRAAGHLGACIANHRKAIRCERFGLKFCNICDLNTSAFACFVRQAGLFKRLFGRPRATNFEYD